MSSTNRTRNDPPFIKLGSKVGETCLSDFALDRLSSGAEPTTLDAAGHLDTCARCRTLLSERRLTKEAFIAATDIPSMAARALADAATPAHHPGGWLPRLRQRVLLIVPLIATAMAMTLFVLIGQDAGESKNDRMRIKGGASLRVIAELGARGRDLRDGDVVQVGDRLRFIVDNSTPIWVAVFGRDDMGGVWRGAPQSSEEMIALEAGKNHLLESAVALDEHGSREEIFLFACARPRPMTELYDVIAQSPEPDVTGCTLHRVSLRKTR